MSDKKRSVTFATFSIERVLKSSPAKVFRAFADPAQKQKWFGGPPEWGEDKRTMDFRVGGTETSVGGPPGGFVSAFRGTYLDIVEPTAAAAGRIVIAYDMIVDDARISVSLNTVELRPAGAGTRLVLTEQGAFLDGHDDPAGREEGTRQLLEQLARFVDVGAA